MADLLIKGMGLPKGNDVLIVDCAGTITRFNKWSEKSEALNPFEFKAVELPNHGRLGDLDMLKEEVSDLRLEKKLKNGATQVIELGELFGKFIDDAPTIVEAST